MAVKIHPTAVLDSAAEIDMDVEIGPYTVIGKDVQIKKGTCVGPHCIIEFVSIGKNNYFTGHDFIGTPPQDFKYKNEKTKLTMGDDNIIREGVSLHRGSTSTYVTVIGSGCMFMANSHVGHDCRIGNGVVMVNSAAASGHVEIEDKVIISGLCGIHQFSKIGALSMLSGGAMVAQDILPYTIAQGDRAKLVGLNIVGLRRAQISTDSIKLIKHVYITLFFKNLLIKDAIAKLRQEKLSPEALHMVEFAEKSKRGLARPRQRIVNSE